ncbi:MAG: CRP-like cAMP-binding protein, partial [Candidatus Azotimanducaceae bacterium]
MTEAIRVIKRQKQREQSFDKFMRPEDVERLLAVEPFVSMDERLFPESSPLREILLKDTRILRLDEGQLIFREGEYGESAFLLLAGEVTGIEDLDQQVQGGTRTVKKGFWETFNQLLAPHELPEFRDVSNYRVDQDLAYQAGGNKEESYVLVENLQELIQKHDCEVVRPGKMFGHVSAMARSPRSRSLIATQDRCEVLEIKWQALRDFMRFSKGFRNYMEEEYRRRSLFNQLQDMPTFSDLSEVQIQQLCQSAVFETYGTSDWNTLLRKAKADPSVKFKETIIVRAGEYAEDLVLILGGFARRTIPYGDGQRTLGYMRRSELFGMGELIANKKSEDAVNYSESLYALGFADVIRLPGSLVVDLLESAGSLLDNSSFEQHEKKTTLTNEREDLMNFLIDNVFINGTKMMLVNQDRCTECDDCVVACANSHEGNPRFIRHGMKTGKFMVANACMHCADPVCMVGCPTGAIR